MPSVPGLERPLTAVEYARRYRLPDYAVVTLIRQGAIRGAKHGGVWYAEDAPPPPEPPRPTPPEEPPPPDDGAMPRYLRVARAFGLVVGVPVALALVIGVAVPAGDEVATVVWEREVRAYEARGPLPFTRERREAHVLHTDWGDVEVSAGTLRAAREGDTLLLQRGPYRLGVREVDQRARLVRDGRVIREERPSDALHAVMALFVLLPLLGFMPYESWRDDVRLKTAIVVIPLMTTLMTLLELLVA